jgi:shikimate kinase
VSRPTVVFLVGFMGSGKTSVGRVLSTHLGLAFIDLDDRIARHAGKSVPGIFAEDGEAAFRAHERAALLALEPELLAGAVIATGGGACQDAAARAWMLARGTMVWLDVPLETIERRVPRDGSRPLFGDRRALDALYQERRSGYASAGLRVDADALAPEDVARLVALRLGEGESA